MTAKTKAVDLSSFDEAMKRQEEGIVVNVLGPDGKTPLGLEIRVAGPDSTRARVAQEQMTDELIAEEKGGQVTAKEANERATRYLAKLTLGWEPAVVMDGEELPCSEANAVRVYARYPFIREQIDRTAGNRARFTKGSPKA